MSVQPVRTDDFISANPSVVKGFVRFVSVFDEKLQDVEKSGGGQKILYRTGGCGYS
jgi:hypothetical protein